MVSLWPARRIRNVLYYGYVMADHPKQLGDSETGPKDRRIPTGIVVALGGLVSLGPNDTLKWEFNPDRAEWKTPPGNLLNSFVTLWQKKPKAIIAFAEKWGPLRVDDRGEPIQGIQNSGSEPLVVWRFLSRRAYAIWRIATALNQGQPGDEEDWKLLSAYDEDAKETRFYGLPNHSRWDRAEHVRRFSGFKNAMDYSRATIAGELTAWLERFRVGLILAWDRKLSWHLEVRYGGHVLAAIALQLALAVADAERLFTCDGCGMPYIRLKKRKPNAGQANYCTECSSNRKPERKAEKRYRENRREARALAAKGTSILEIANKLDRMPSVVRGWLK